MRDAQATVTYYRKDYQPPLHRILSTHLEFDLDPKRTKVSSLLSYQRWSGSETESPADLILDGEDLELESIVLNGTRLTEDDYTVTDTLLTLHKVPNSGVLQITVFICPENNSRLEGLYLSKGAYFTQCEAQGFRRITYFQDRPDVLSKFTVELITSPSTHPVALSNGNLVGETKLADGRIKTVWEDPFPKPSYLFALVAGKLECQEEWIERPGLEPALLQVWVEPGNLDKTDFAMQSLKRSIQWDRERFGLELDLDRFMIVATADFNMGAMENKGLNIFNTRFVFANPRLATDVDFENVESVVGHEYFHNWTGNRVTCQDWFQLSLKEGLTVFRDQEFTSDMLAKGLDDLQAASARAVKRIDDVKVLRSAQFPEDAGPMAHPIRPDSYQEINNFYTITVYEKGAEVIRMQHTLLGEERFQRGMQIYFERHDGQAATCEHFVCAMETALQEAAPERDLKQFRNWYSQAGTPILQAHWSHDPEHNTLSLTLSQSCPATPGQIDKKPFHIPVKIGLVGPDGRDLPIRTVAPANQLDHDIWNLTQVSETLVFNGVPTGTVPSLLRGFSAPVKLRTVHTLSELQFLASHDSDPFNRWDAAQEIYSKACLEVLGHDGSVSGPATQGALEVFTSLLNDPDLSAGYKALALQLPSEGTLFEASESLVDPVALHLARCGLRDLFAASCAHELESQYNSLHVDGAPYQYSAIDAGSRSLKNCLLSYLTALSDSQSIALMQCAGATHMTDRIAALTALVHLTDDADEALREFYEDFKNEALALDKWFMVQSTRPMSAVEDSLARIRQLAQHPDFTLKNPNRARSLIAGLCMQNPSVFHSHDGEGYKFWADQVIALNAINPQVAARMARALDRWTRLVPALQSKAQEQLERILALDGLSTDVREIVGKALGGR